jgi:hypothetical protein
MSHLAQYWGNVAGTILMGNWNILNARPLSGSTVSHSGFYFHYLRTHKYKPERLASSFFRITLFPKKYPSVKDDTYNHKIKNPIATNLKSQHWQTEAWAWRVQGQPVLRARRWVTRSRLLLLIPDNNHKPLLCKGDGRKAVPSTVFK